jgi:DNA-binding transcriptional LysR family regulator
MINLNEIAVFLAAAESSNFSQAGRKLHLSQPAISQTIYNLEKQFRMKLFVRQGRTVRLTEAGQVLRSMAVELLAVSRRLEETMSSLQGDIVGELNIGCSTASGKYLLPGLIARYRRQYPQVRINVLVGSRDGVINKVLSGMFALGVCSKRVEHRDLEYQKLFTDEVILIVPADHRWTRKPYILPDDLLDEPTILREEGAGVREVLFEALFQHDITPDMLNVAMVLGNAEAIEIAVAEGLGIGFVSRLAAARSLELARIVQVDVKNMSLCRDVFLARNRRFPPTQAQVEFWSFARSAETDAMTAIRQMT